MSLAITYSRAAYGINAPLITVETHLSNGLPKFSIVGLPDTEVKESKDRVRSALLNSHFEFPAQRITVNLAPADLPKGGSRFDLAIAIGILAASKQIPADQLSQYEFAAELALSGELRPIKAALPFAIANCKTERILILPPENAAEANLIEGMQLHTGKHILDVCSHLKGQNTLNTPNAAPTTNNSTLHYSNLNEVKGQAQARRALEIAAAGQHSLLFIGPPGTGKSMLAARLPSILPVMNLNEGLEAAAIASLSSQGFTAKQWRQRPFRAPHHTASSVALVGGGSPPRPGEVSLAHNGILFLDELPEFNRRVLEALREPLESGSITISRAAQQTEFPAQFQLIAAMNPCPCGYHNDSENICQCTSEQIQRYQAKLSGPLLDRIDMHVDVPRLATGILSQTHASESSESVRQRVIICRERQSQRNGKTNANLTPTELEQFCHLTNAEQVLLETAMRQLGLSARAYHRIIKVARTIADLAESTNIQQQHLAEALSYRRLGRRITAIN